MHQAPVTPGQRCPEAKGYVRKVSANITTTVLTVRDSIIRAEYCSTTLHESPYAGPFLFTRMSPAKSGGWQGETLVHAFGATEIRALGELICDLESIGIDPGEPARACLAALSVASKATPWELQPLGIRGPKPKAARYQWRCPDTGKVIHLHKQTMRRHKDPACVCRYCTMFSEPTTTETP